MKLITILFITIISLTGLFAGPVENLEKEFSQVEEFYKNDTPSEEDKKRLLEKNILSAVKITLLKRYENSTEMTKNLSIDKIDYQYMPETFSCYVRFDNYYLFYKFYKDARIYHQTPIFEKFYFKPKNMTPAAHDPAKKN